MDSPAGGGDCAMTASDGWIPAEGSPAGILEQFPRPLEALVAGEIPGVVLRGPSIPITAPAS